MDHRDPVFCRLARDVRGAAGIHGQRLVALPLRLVHGREGRAIDDHRRSDGFNGLGDRSRVAYIAGPTIKADRDVPGAVKESAPDLSACAENQQSHVRFRTWERPINAAHGYSRSYSGQTANSEIVFRTRTRTDHAARPRVGYVYRGRT